MKAVIVVSSIQVKGSSLEGASALDDAYMVLGFMQKINGKKHIKFLY